MYNSFVGEYSSTRMDCCKLQHNVPDMCYAETMSSQLLTYKPVLSVKNWCALMKQL